MKQVGVAVIGAGWRGGIRAEACVADPLVERLHIAEVRPDRLAEMAPLTRPKSVRAVT